MDIHKVYMHLHEFTWMHVDIATWIKMGIYTYAWLYMGIHKYTWVLGVSSGGMSSWLLPFCGSGGLLNSVSSCYGAASRLDL